MMAKKKFDELNILSASDDSSDAFDYHDFIEHYFDPMQISERQKRKRIEAAEDLFDTILYFLSWCEEFPDKVQEEETKEEFENRYRETVFQYGEPDNYFDSYIPLFVSNLLKTTADHQGEEYYTSVERAANIAVNESNSVLNYTDLQAAIENGYSYKKWITELDDRTRIDHFEMDGTIIPINDYFVFPDCAMFMPHDEINGTPNQLVNCRCSLKYINLQAAGAKNVEDITAQAEEEKKKARLLYDEITNRKKEFEIKAVSEHSDYSYEDVEKIYNHIFVKEHLFENGSIHKFAPDLEMANSWLRLRNGNPLYHDKVMLNHEFEEQKIMNSDIDIPYEIAHYKVISMGRDYDYNLCLKEYLRSRNK